MHFNHPAARALPFAAAAFLLPACNGGGAGVSPGLPVSTAPSSHGTPLVRRPGHDPSNGKIKHIVIIVQENRSFNNLFYGYKGARTARYGYDTNGDKIKLLPIPLETTWDIEHDSYGDIAACDGTGTLPGTNCKNNGFNNEHAYCYSHCPIPHPEYAYVPHSETAPYFAMANEWVLADHMFASNFDASSFISHQYIISAQAEKAINFPDGAWGCPGGPSDTINEVGSQRQPYGSEVVCWDPTTLGDELDKANVSWAFYGEIYSQYDPWIWMAYQAIKHIYEGPDWSKDMISPPQQIITDVANGNLRSVSWVTPSWTNSDHAGSGSNTGPSWVAAVVNSIGESQYWDSTAIFVMWDDYGGWFDPVPQPYEDLDGLGMRIPMLVISPYALQGHVSHVQYEHGSILKFVEDTFGLGRLTQVDTRAKSPARGCFDFKQPPRAFVPIQSPYDKAFFLHQPPDNHVVDAE